MSQESQQVPGQQASDQQAPGQQAPHQRAPHPFFSWLRGLGVLRVEGWIGGVASGLAARIRIDPLIVRGIFVVLGLLGAPMLLVYAICWLLLPDATGKIHLEQLVHGHLEPALIGILIFGVGGFIPPGITLWWAGGAAPWAYLPVPAMVFRVFWSIVAIALLTLFIIWLIRRADWGAHPQPGAQPQPATQPQSATHATSAAQTTPAQSDAQHAAFAQTGTPAEPQYSAAAEAEGSGQMGSDTGAGAVEAPVSATVSGGDPDADMNAWREQQEGWRSDHAAWHAQQQEQREQQRLARHTRAEEQRTQAAEYARRAAEERRARRLRRPRISGAFVAITLGSTLLVSVITMVLASGTAAARGWVFTLAIAAAVTTLGVAMIVAGFMRRRSGLLATLSILLVVVMAISIAPPRDRTLLLTGSTINLETSGNYAVLLGNTNLYFDEGSNGSERVIDIWQVVGDVSIHVEGDVRMRVERMSDGDSQFPGLFATRAVLSDRPDQDWSYESLEPRVTQTAEGVGERIELGWGSPTITVRIHQAVGTVRIDQMPADVLEYMRQISDSEQERNQREQERREQEELEQAERDEQQRAQQRQELQDKLDELERDRQELADRQEQLQLDLEELLERQEQLQLEGSEQ